MGLFFKSKRRPVASAVEPGQTPRAGSPLTDDAVERRTRALAGELLAAARANQSGLLSRAFWSDKLMTWAMKDEAFKVQLFRFVDCFPTLKTPEQIREHLLDYMNQPGVKLPPGMGLGLAAGGLAEGLFARTMSGQIQGMAQKFIAGQDAATALPVLKKLWAGDICFSVDLLGEACISQTEVEAFRRRYLDLIETLPARVQAWPANDLLERDHLGPIPRVNVSIKISSLSAKTDPIDFEGSLQRSIEGLLPILQSAGRNGVLVNFDMEHHALKDFTLELFMRCCGKVDFHAGIAMQAYLKSGDADAKRIIDWSRGSGRVVTVRLVKGAYWDFETIQAEQQGWPVPVWSTKPQTDACFERMSRAFIDAMPSRAGEGGVKLALGSHNLRSIAAALAMLEARGLPATAIELQMLHGMADQLKAVAVERRLRLREYVPVGEMIPGMAYLVRRLLENTSNESWLRAGFLDDADSERLIRSPHGIDATTPATDVAQKHALSAAPNSLGVGPMFTEPMRDFSDAAQRDQFAAAITKSKVPAVAIDATIEQADAAVRQARAQFDVWRDVEPASRANVLLKAASIMRSRRDALSGVIIRENGKNWRNADADVCEAIDFCEYYAREAMSLFEPRRLGRFVGELNLQFYQPRGVCVVISPWNFPLAIACGMATAALVTGNTVVLKPAEQTPVIARTLVDILHEAGIPRSALHFVAGAGETVGAALVRHPQVSAIAFTGSRDVGLDILRAAAATRPDADCVKRVVCEMGGKNAIIVDASADLDEAVVGVRDSAFGFSGQKCSACSRAVVVESCYDAFVHRLVESTKSLGVGDPILPGTDLGPMIDDAAADKARQFIAAASVESTVALAIDAGGRLVGPHIFTDVLPTHRLAREEVFGPVLAILRARDFEHALTIANDSAYKLTGGVFSRKPANLDRARRAFRVGNLYLNRGITGALVGRQPFGGFGMSGVGSKAGGADYLLQFVEPRVVTENTMRRGFAPD
jgi:RHH-type transcriptional regulator, proline utilization regulon repressor / proline dehydrogenase / delta 1-pyrroline-5-carboxylate dehydrogenase